MMAKDELGSCLYNQYIFALAGNRWTFAWTIKLRAKKSFLDKETSSNADGNDPCVLSSAIIAVYVARGMAIKLETRIARVERTQVKTRLYEAFADETAVEAKEKKTDNNKILARGGTI